jgi:hypothetical protein
MPSSTSGRHSPIGFSRSRNAMNMVRKPESQRGPQLARRANETVPGIRTRRRPLRNFAEPISTASSSPASESTRAGSRIAQMVASTNSTNA